MLNILAYVLCTVAINNCLPSIPLWCSFLQKVSRRLMTKHSMAKAYSFVQLFSSYVDLMCMMCDVCRMYDVRTPSLLSCWVELSWVKCVSVHVSIQRQGQLRQGFLWAPHEYWNKVSSCNSNEKTDQF